MRGAPVTWIVGAKCHLDFIEYTFGNVATGNKRFGGLFNAHRNAGGIVLRRHDEVGFLNNPILVGLVMMDERPARGFYYANTVVIFGVRMQAAQSSVGNVLSNIAMWPPIVGSRSIR